ncbi:HET-domain-containing protein [Nemania serpens]|nr:HET-domain-containing protein [Nemania serpens]
MSRASQRQLCTFCQGINLEDLKSARGYVHQPTGGALIESGEDCHLCQLLVDSFTRCIYEQHLAQYSIRQISDVRHLGPVSLFAASRDLDSNEHFFQRRTKNVVRDRVLSRRVAVTLGVVDTDLPNDPICDSNISRILSWADRCRKYHHACNQILSGFRTSETAPKRLIDVGLPEQQHNIHLILTNGVQHKKHAGIVTTADTIDQLKQGISLDKLSKSIQDAIIVVRKLGIRYLWPRNVDWKEESSKTGYICNNAYLTIAATSASDASEGFLTRFNGSGTAIDFKIYFREYTSIQSSFRNDVENSILLRRAWIKQERTLSPRMVDFSTKQLYWSCRTNRHSEDGQIDTESGIEASGLLHCLRGGNNFQRATGKSRTQIQGLLFRARADTVQQDRLPALAGSYHLLGSVSTGGRDPETSRIRLLRASTNNAERHALHVSGRIHRCKVDAKEQPPLPLCRSDRKLKDPRVEVPRYKFTLEAAVGPRPPGAEFENVCRFDGPRSLQPDFYVLGLKGALVGNDTQCGLLLKRLGWGDDRESYERVGRMWSSDHFWYAQQESEISLV